MVTRAAGDLQALDGISLAVKDALIRIAGILADGGPRLVAQVNVLGEDGADAAAAVVDLLRKPPQLAGIGDLIGRSRITRTRGLFGHGNVHRLRRVGGYLGQIDRACLCYVAVALKCPIIRIAHRQQITAVCFCGHGDFVPLRFCINDRDGRLRVCGIAELHGGGSLFDHPHGFRHRTAALHDLHAAVGLVLKAERAGDRVGIGAADHGIHAVAAIHRLAVAVLYRQRSVIRHLVKFQRVGVAFQRDGLPHIRRLDGHGAGLGGVVAGFVGDGVGVLALVLLCQGVHAVHAAGLLRAVPHQLSVCRYHRDGHRGGRRGIHILPSQDGVAAVEAGLVILKGIAQGEGQTFELVGGCGGKASHFI